MAAVIDVAHIFADEVANDRSVDVAYQIGGENKTAIQSDHDIKTAPAGCARNLLAERGYSRGDPRGRIPRTIPRAYGMRTSAIHSSPFDPFVVEHAYSVCRRPRGEKPSARKKNVSQRRDAQLPCLNSVSPDEGPVNRREAEGTLTSGEEEQSITFTADIQAAGKLKEFAGLAALGEAQDGVNVLGGELARARLDLCGEIEDEAGAESAQSRGVFDGMGSQ
jgi:hypothetical protein